jgi:hypothetical protein
VVVDVVADGLPEGDDESSRGASDPTPPEILVKGVLMHRWTERNGAYDELVARWS